MIEGVEIVREGDRFQLVLRGTIEIASSDGTIEVKVNQGVGLVLADDAARQILEGARDVIGPWNEIRERVREELAKSG